jgi:hypothetical protein
VPNFSFLAPESVLYCLALKVLAVYPLLRTVAGFTCAYRCAARVLFYFPEQFNVLRGEFLVLQTRVDVGEEAASAPGRRSLDLSKVAGESGKRLELQQLKPAASSSSLSSSAASSDDPVRRLRRVIFSPVAVWRGRRAWRAAMTSPISPSSLGSNRSEGAAL